MISSRATLDWYFKADPAKPMAAPVFLTRFFPAGRAEQPLHAAPNSITTVAVSAGRSPQGPDPKLTKVTATTVRARSSVDDGRTWNAATTVRHTDSIWQATVNDPAFAVALPSEVADSAGDSSVETVYQAYAIGRASHAAAVVTGARCR
ncbi:MULTISPECIES: hypothetical protein [Streptomyces]|uniref:hypothetical protein n=1 Tax=Streptomyces TaxID=1883 RepID=UPI003330DA96